MAMASDRRADMAAWTKANLPTCASVAAEFRGVFGDVRMVWAAEAGHTLGTRGPDGVPLVDTVVGRMFPAKAMR